jgi:APA family basic amino acid/polyamine antiporter
MGMIPPHQLANSQFPFAEAGKLLFGVYGAGFVVICAFVSGIGTLNASILLQAQVIFAAARDKYLPKQLAKLSKNDAPVAGQILGGIVVTIVLLATIRPTMLKQFDIIALVASLLALSTYLMSTLAELKFLLTPRKKLVKVILSGTGIVTILAGAYTAWMVSCFQANVIYITLTLIITCILLYFFAVKKWSTIKLPL